MGEVRGVIEIISVDLLGEMRPYVDFVLLHRTQMNPGSYGVGSHGLVPLMAFEKWVYKEAEIEIPASFYQQVV